MIKNSIAEIHISHFPGTRQENFLRGRLFSYLGVFLLLWLGAIFTILSPIPCIGSESGEELATFSLEADQQALGEVLQEISEATGYEITIDSEHAQLPITVSLKNVTVHEALRRIFGRLSKYMVINDAAKKISLNIVDANGKKIGAGQMSDQVAVVGKKTDPVDVEVVPPAEPGGGSFTQREVEAIRARQVKIDPMEIEEVPPANPGEKSFTLREIEAIRSKQKETVPKQIEEVPPENM
jgi:hypothetical protein